MYRTAADMREPRYGRDDEDVAECRARARELSAQPSYLCLYTMVCESSFCIVARVEWLVYQLGVIPSSKQAERVVCVAFTREQGSSARD